MREIEKVLDSSEKVMWEGTPRFWPFFIPSFIGVIVGIIMLAFTVPFFYLSFVSTGSMTEALMVAMVPAIFAFIGIIVLLSPLWTYMSYKNIYYAITSKRVIVQSGIIGRDFQFVDFDQITNATVNVDIIDIITGKHSGSINMMTAGTRTISTKNGSRTVPISYDLSHVPDPYDVFKFFKKTSFDVKADMQFPNALRPKENAGYTTDYTPDTKPKP